MNLPNPLSRGSIAVVDFGGGQEPVEYFAIEGTGELCRAPVGNVLDCRTGYRLGRFEAPEHLVASFLARARADAERWGGAYHPTTP